MHGKSAEKSLRGERLADLSRLPLEVHPSRPFQRCSNVCELKTRQQIPYVDVSQQPWPCCGRPSWYRRSRTSKNWDLSIFVLISRPRNPQSPCNCLKTAKTQTVISPRALSLDLKRATAQKR